MNVIKSSDGKATLRNDQGILVLHLSGTDVEMARQHGELLSAEIAAGMLPLLVPMFGQVASNNSFAERVQNRLASFGFSLLCRKISANLPKQYKRVYRELAAAAKIPSEIARLAPGVPDALMVMLDLLERRSRFFRPPQIIPDSMGCSGFVALRDATANGHVIHGRNLDYEGFGYWDRFPLIAFCQPSKGQRYAWISTAGLHGNVLTSMNDAGLFMGSNTAPTREVSLKGYPMIAVNDRIIRDATTIGQAIDLMPELRCASGYNMILSHGDCNDAVVIEHSHSSHRVRYPEKNLLISTNHYLHPHMSKTFPARPVVDLANSEGRYKQLQLMLEEQQGSLTPRIAANCLRHIRRVDGVLQPLADNICNYMNLSSVVADMTARRIYVAADRAPVALGQFVSFDFDREFENFDSPRTYPSKVISASPQAAGADVPSREFRAISGWHKACSLLISAPERAYEALIQCRQLYPREARVMLALSLVGLRIGRIAEAERYAQLFLERSDKDNHRRYRAFLIIGWCADLSGNRTKALEYYGKADEAGGTEVPLELAIWYRRRFTRKDMDHLHIDLFNVRRLIV